MSDTLTAPTETAPRTLTLEELDALPVGAIVLLTKNLDGRTEAAVKTASRASGYARSAWRMTSGSTYPGSGVMLHYGAVLLAPVDPPADLV